jgi:hypothetical protein
MKNVNWKEKIVKSKYIKKKICRNKIIYLLVHLHHQEMIIEIEVIIVHQIEVIVDQTKFLVEIKIDDDLDRDQGKKKI